MPEHDADSPAVTVAFNTRPSMSLRPQFLAYWSGGLISNAGTWLQSVTAPALILDLPYRPSWTGEGALPERAGGQS